MTKRKLLILDEDTNRKNNFASRLRSLEYDIELATGGFHALHLIEKFSYASVLIFDDMNDMPGNEVLTLMRENFSKTKLPILFVSKNPSEEKILELFKEGVNDFIAYSPNFFAQVVEKLKKHVVIKK